MLLAWLSVIITRYLYIARRLTCPRCIDGEQNFYCSIRLIFHCANGGFLSLVCHTSPVTLQLTLCLLEKFCQENFTLAQNTPESTSFVLVVVSIAYVCCFYATTRRSNIKFYPKYEQLCLFSNLLSTKNMNILNKCSSVLRLKQSSKALTTLKVYSIRILTITTVSIKTTNYRQ